MEHAHDTTAAPASDTRRWWTLVIFAYVALEGASLQMRGSVVPVLRETFGTPDWQLGLVAPAGTIGFLVLVALVGAIAGRVNTRRVFLVGIVGTGVSVFLIGFTPSFAFFLVALLARGSFGGIGRGTDRPLLSHLHPSDRGKWFSYYDAMWAVGATIGPLVVTAALWVGDWRLAYYTLGVAFLPLALLVWWLPAPRLDGDGDDVLTVSEIRRVGRRPEVLVMAAGIFLSTGVEGALFTWLTTFAAGRVPAALVTPSLSVLLVAYIPGRFVAGKLSTRVGSVQLMLGLAVVCLLSVIYTFFVASGLGVLVGLFGIGFSLSGQYPTLLAYSTEAAPEHSAPINSFALVVSAVGIAGVPAALGFVISDSGIALAMQLLVIPLVALVGVAVMAWVRVGEAVE
ncbi:MULTISPECIES: sugar MFS transporter [Haloferax]|uniref:MFS transporter n=2 Tax=Haloferax TaxID=2251 RepID=A0A6G1Z0Y6_9EURY|nr:MULTISPECIES: MFS transporter [Haloferax]KAB1187531.1 MFS transporter [Haloferax sp. CBA1149]MRW80183.1 MFS transporter [Haloferax marinisediminis]